MSRPMPRPPTPSWAWSCRFPLRTSSTVKQTLSENESLATGYSPALSRQLGHWGQPRLHPRSRGLTTATSPTCWGQPGAWAVVGFLRAVEERADFLSPKGLIGVLFNTFPARMTGKVEINMTARQTANHLGRANAFRADQGQPITIGSIVKTGSHVTINSPLGGTLAIGTELPCRFRSGDPWRSECQRQDRRSVTIGSGAVVDRTSLGSGSTVGTRAYLLNSTFPAGTVIPPGAIYINNQFEGYVQW